MLNSVQSRQSNSYQALGEHYIELPVPWHTSETGSWLPLNWIQSIGKLSRYIQLPVCSWSLHTVYSAGKLETMLGDPLAFVSRMGA